MTPNCIQGLQLLLGGAAVDGAGWHILQVALHTLLHAEP